MVKCDRNTIKKSEIELCKHLNSFTSLHYLYPRYVVVRIEFVWDAHVLLMRQATTHELLLGLVAQPTLAAGECQRSQRYYRPNDIFLYNPDILLTNCSTTPFIILIFIRQ